MHSNVHESMPSVSAEALFRDHSAFVACFLRRLGAAPDEIDDLVQDVFLVAHRRGGFTLGVAHPRTWLAEIGLRLVSSARRKSIPRRTAPTAAEIVASVPATTASPFETVAAGQALQRVQQAIDTMDLDHRTVFLLYELEGDSCESISAAMRIPLGTVHSRLHTARRSFRAAYERLNRQPSPSSAKGPVSGFPIRFRDDPNVPGEPRQELSLLASPLSPTFDVSQALARFRASAAAPSAIAVSTAAVAITAATAALAILGAAWIGLRTTPAAVASSSPMAIPATTGDAPQNAAPQAPPSAQASTSDVSAAPVPSTATSAPSEPTCGARVSPSTAPSERHDAMLEEMQQVAHLREISEGNPGRAVELADEGNRRFPRGLLHQERESIAIRALVRLGRRNEARARAQLLLDGYPRGPFSAQVRRVTGLDEEATP